MTLWSISSRKWFRSMHFSMPLKNMLRWSARVRVLNDTWCSAYDDNYVFCFLLTCCPGHPRYAGSDGCRSASIIATRERILFRTHFSIYNLLTMSICTRHQIGRHTCGQRWPRNGRLAEDRNCIHRNSGRNTSANRKLSSRQGIISCGSFVQVEGRWTFRRMQLFCIITG